MKTRLFIWLSMAIILLSLPLHAQEFVLNGRVLPREELTLQMQVKPLKNMVIYEVSNDLSITSYFSSTLKVQKNDTAIIFVKENKTLTIACTRNGAGIEVQEGGFLIIAGEKNSHLKVKGGDAWYSMRGDDGDGALVQWRAGALSHAGHGGNGGKGGDGAGAAIGGIGGDGGNPGLGAPEIKTVPFVTRAGNKGSSGYDGKSGTGMGDVYISGHIQVDAKSGTIGTDGRERSSHGGNCTGWYWLFGYRSLNAGAGGGGGNGGNGAPCKYAIGGGAPGGGGGGGGGSGALDAYRTRVNGDGAPGQGGEGGGQYDTQFRLTNALRGIELDRVRAANNTNVLSGEGGAGGHPGEYGSNGSLFLQSSQNILGGVTATTCQQWKPIVAISYPIPLMLHYKNGVKTTGGPQDYNFYYGMVPPQSITIPVHDTDPKNYLFGGYYLPNGTMIYDKNGHLTTAGNELLYQFNDIELSAQWAGPSWVHLLLKYEMPNGTNTEQKWNTVAVDSFYHLQIDETKSLSCCAKQYLPKGYSTNVNQCLSVELKHDMQVKDSFIYTLNRHQLQWSIPQDKGGSYGKVYMKDSKGNSVTTLQQTVAYGIQIVPPRLFFHTSDDSLAVRSVWNNAPQIMPDSSVTTITLQLDSLQFSIYTNRNDSGTTLVRNQRGDTARIGKYGENITIQLTPKTGNHAAPPRVHTYVDGRLGDTLPVIKVDENTYRFKCTNTVMIIPVFKPNLFTIRVNYTGTPKDCTASTYALTARNPKPVEATTLPYQYGDNIVFSAWVNKDSADNWMITPVVRTVTKGDTLPLQMVLTNQLSNDVNARKWMVSFVVTAPNDHIEINQTITYLPRTSCKVFNRTQVPIDSIFVNLNRVEISADSTIQVRAMDFVSLQVNSRDTAAMQAGYWDDNKQYHSLQRHIEQVAVAGGNYATRFSTLAPDKPMTIGLVNGLKIKSYCDTSLVMRSSPAAIEGDSVQFEIFQLNNDEIVQLDSVVFCNDDKEVMYRFIGDEAWFNTIRIPDCDLTAYVYATVSGEYQSVTYLNANGDTLQHSNSHLLGDLVPYYGEIPELPSDSYDYRWRFLDWTPALHPINGDDVYRATYRAELILDDEENNEALLEKFHDQIVDVSMTTSLMEPTDFYPVSFPFTIPMDQVYASWGEQTEVSEFHSTKKENDIIYLHFSPLTTNELKAGVPYMMRPSYATAQVCFDSVKIDSHVDTIRHPLAEFRAAAVPTWMPEYDFNYRFVKNSTLYWPLNCTGPLHAFKAYFYMSDDETFAPTTVYLVSAIDDEDYVTIDLNGAADPYTGIEQLWTPTSLMEIISKENPSSGARKVILNQTFYIICNGILYNAQGQKISNQSCKSALSAQ